MKAILGAGHEDFIPPIIWDIAYCLCYINSTINPFCYALCNATFRSGKVKLIVCWHDKCDTFHCFFQKDICPDSDVQVGLCQEATSEQVLLWISPQVWVYRMFISWVKNKCWYLIQRQGLEAQEKICDQTPSQWWISAFFFFCLFSLNGLLVVIAVS